MKGALAVYGTTWVGSVAPAIVGKPVSWKMEPVEEAPEEAEVDVCSSSETDAEPVVVALALLVDAADDALFVAEVAAEVALDSSLVVDPPPRDAVLRSGRFDSDA